MRVRKIKQLKVGQKYEISNGSFLLGTFVYVEAEGMNTETSVFFDPVDGLGERPGHTAFHEDFKNYIYREVN